jgi:uncharacterized UBP type Zn finger protein
MTDKVKTHVKFDPYLYVPVSVDDGLADSMENIQGSDHPNTVKYELIGVIVHLGYSVHSGHYIAYVKV